MKIYQESRKKHILLPSPQGQIRPCPILTDPQGCYTGKPLEQFEIPVQDADDL